MFAGFADGSSAADYYPRASIFESGLELHPQYVLENGVDFAHFKFVHKTPIIPVFTRHDFAEPVSYVDFTITFEGDDNQTIDDVRSGVEAINGGLGIAVTKSWGMIDNRTISAVTPVDENTSDVRFTVYIGRTPGKDTPRAEAKAQEFGTKSSASSARTSISGHTNGIRTRRRCPRRNSRGSPRSVGGPCSSIPMAVAAAPRTSVSRHSTRRADLRWSQLHGNRFGCSRSRPATSVPR